MQENDFAFTWDGESGLPDRAGWVAVLQVEEQRARRHGGMHGLVLVRLEGPADRRVSARTAAAIAGVIRDIDFLAQMDHQTFAVLALHCNDLAALVQRLRDALESSGVPRSALIDARPAGGDLRATWVAMSGTLPVTRPTHIEFVVQGPPSPN